VDWDNYYAALLNLDHWYLYEFYPRIKHGRSTYCPVSHDSLIWQLMPGQRNPLSLVSSPGRSPGHHGLPEGLPWRWPRRSCRSVTSHRFQFTLECFSQRESAEFLDESLDFTASVTSGLFQRLKRGADGARWLAKWLVPHGLLHRGTFTEDLRCLFRGRTRWANALESS
jgi:hypothetical protein